MNTVQIGCLLIIGIQMITEGYLISVEQDGQKYIRSLNKTEQKNLNLKEAI